VAKLGHFSDKMIEKLAFASCGIGLNVTFAIYLAYINIFAVAFTSRRIMGWMNASIYISAFTIVGLQMKFSRHLDKKFGCKAWCTFQIMAGLFMMCATLVAIPFATSVYHVYLFGVLIGIFEGGALSALQQLACAVHTDMTKFVNTGFTVAQIVPIGLSLVLDFHNTQTGNLEAVAFAIIPAFFCLLTAVLFAVVIFKYRSFDAAFARLESQQTDGSTDGGGSHDDIFDDGGEGMPLVSKGKDAQKSVWLIGPVLTCAVVNFMAHFLSMFFMPFLTFIGSMQIAHILVLVRFGGEFLGRIAAHYVTLDSWGRRDHGGLSVLVSLTVMRAAVLFVLILGAFNVVNIGHGPLLMGLTVLFYFVFAWTNSEVMAVVTKFAPKNKEREVMNGMMFLTFGAQLFSLAVAQLFVYSNIAPAAHHAAVVHLAASPAWLDNPGLNPL